MRRDNKIKIAAIFILFAVSAAPLFGQATFSVSSASTAATAIGATELTGTVTLTIVSGRSVDAPFALQFSAPITNNSASEIKLTGTGGLTAVAGNPSVDIGSNSLVFQVPANATTGNITIAGVRVALAGRNLSSVTATISSPTSSGNGIIAGQGPVTVINAIANQPFTVDETSSPSLQWQNGQVLVGTTSIVIAEKYETAFTSDVGIYGQTVPTRFEIKPYRPIPAGAKVTFDAVATAAGTGATLTTTSGIAETIPRGDGSTKVTYQYSSAGPASVANTESFSVRATVNLDAGSTGSGAVVFQVTLVPIGIATPNAEFPETNIPRYSQLTLPPESELPTGSVDLAFPFRAQSTGTYTGLAMTNPQNYPVNVTLTAFDMTGNVVSGVNVANPVALSIPTYGQVAKLASEVFGSNFNAATGGTIRAQGKTVILPGFYLIGDLSGPRLDGATADLSATLSWIWPNVFHKQPSPVNVLELFNPGTTTANITMRLYNSAGILLSTAQAQVLPNGSMAADAAVVFIGTNMNSFSGGYIKGSSDVPVIPRETFGNSLDNNVIRGQNTIQQISFRIAHFASGGGYETEINILNNDTSALAQIALTALDDSGTPLAISGNPKSISIPPSGQSILTMKELFPALSASLTTGYIRVDITPSSTGPFVNTPIISGSVRFSAADGYASAALPLILSPSADFVYSHVAQNLGYYTGITMLNLNTTAASVTLEVRDKAGVLVGSYATTLQPGQKIAKLVYEMVPRSQGQIGGYVRIRSSLPISSFSLFGTNDGKSLSAIPPQPAS